MVFVTGTRRYSISIRWPEGWKSVFYSFWWIRTNSTFDGCCKKITNLISWSLWNVRPTKNISSSPVISSVSCIRCFPIWIVYDAVSVFSLTAPFQNPAWNRLNTFWVRDSRIIPSQFTWYLFTANHLMFPSSQFILFRIIVPSFSTFYRERNQQRHQETNRLSNTHCRNEINVERDGNQTQSNIDSIYNKCCY